MRGLRAEAQGIWKDYVSKGTPLLNPGSTNSRGEVGSTNSRGEVKRLGKNSRFAGRERST